MSSPPEPPVVPEPHRSSLEARSGILRRLPKWTTAVTAVVLTPVLGDVLAGAWSDSPLGLQLKPYITGISYVIVPLLLIAWMVARMWERGRTQSEHRPELDHPGPLARLRPAWGRPRPGSDDQLGDRWVLRGRDEVVATAVESVAALGVVAVVGPSGSGTSAVVRAVVDELIAGGQCDAARTVPFDLGDLRACGPGRPAIGDAVVVAERVLRAFGLDGPASDAGPVLADCGRRLVEVLDADRATVVLDNVARPEQVAWLLHVLPSGPGAPLLVLAGGPALDPTTRPGHPVLDPACRTEYTLPLGPLDLAELWSVWSDAGGPVDQRLVGPFGACAGLPGAVRDLALEFERPGSPWDVGELVSWVGNADHVDPLEHVWTAILGRTRGSLSEEAASLLDALADLPVGEVSVDALAAIRAELAGIGLAAAGPEHGPDGMDEPAGAFVIMEPHQDLRQRRLLRSTPEGRYRVPAPVRVAVRATATRPDRRQAAAAAALRALTRHYAELAARWAAGLDETSRAAAAGYWFDVEELALRSLFDESLAGDREVVENLSRIADSLDAWFARRGRLACALGVHAAVHALARRAELPGLEQVAALRLAAGHRAAGDLRAAGQVLAEAWSRDERLPRRPGSAAVRARLRHEQAMLCVARAEARADPESASGDLEEAERELQRAWNLVPSADAAGEVTTLVNLAVVYLRQNRPDRALDRLDVAESRARPDLDPGGQGWVAELRGVAEWMRGELTPAVGLWWHALGLYRELGDARGEGRMWQHLGSAVVVAPELAGLVLDRTTRPTDEAEAVEHARGWLEHSWRLRAGQPDTRVLDHYLDLVRSPRPAVPQALRALAPGPIHVAADATPAARRRPFARIRSAFRRSPAR